MPSATDEPGAPESFHWFRYDTTGLRNKRMRLMTDFPASDAGHPQDALMGYTDVVSLDDTPSVLHDVRVCLADDPITTGLVCFDQLALYDGQ